LRLTPQSQVNPEKLGRWRNQIDPSMSRPWEFGKDAADYDDGDDDE
jgi:hypothetical protein